MSEDLDNKDVKVSTEKKTTTRRKVTKDVAQKPPAQEKIETPKYESLNAEYKYEAKEGEKLITDMPSTPLQKVEPLKEVKQPVTEVKNNNIRMQKPSTPIKTNGQIYDAYIKELKDFKLVYNGDVIFDSTLSKNNSTLKFEADYFVLFSKKYSYNGLRVQKI